MGIGITRNLLRFQFFQIEVERPWPQKKRDIKNTDLEGTNIKVSKKGGKTYYYYIMPDGSHEPLAHENGEQSKQAAIALNMALRPVGSIVDRIISTPPRPTTKDPIFIEVPDEFRIFTTAPLRPSGD